MELMTIAELRRAAQNERLAARVHAQLVSLAQKQTREGKPYWELGLADGGGKMILRAWSDTEVFSLCSELQEGEFLEVEGDFVFTPAFGLDARSWVCRPLEDEEIAMLLGGSAELQEKQAQAYATVVELITSVADPRLRGVAELFLQEQGERFRRAAAARNYHHARRGGLVEHVSQMMRVADQVAAIYPALNRDLLLVGTFFHDIGKLWENCPDQKGFGIPYDERGELLGHISIGIELVNTYWRRLLETPAAAEWKNLKPGNEQVRLHLLHLIASHHGDLAFGSPVVPKTPEAFALHFIDNLDAKLEMAFAAYQNGTPLSDRIVERVRPLPGNLVQPLPKCEPPEPESGGFDPELGF